MVRVAVVAAALGLAVSAGGQARAQLSSSGGPISYSADNLEYFDERRQLVLTGDVEVVQDDATLRADELTLFFAPSQSAEGVAAGDIERIVATGEVFYVLPDQTARGDRAVYETASDSVTFTGNVIVANAENVVRGETLVLQIGAGRATIRPGGAPGQRVRGLLGGRQQRPVADPQAPPAGGDR